MNWNEMFPKDKEPALTDIAEYAGSFKDLWLSLVDFFETTYKAKPKITHSACGGKPGWNVKFQKSGQAFGTWYPGKDAFDMMIIIAYKLDDGMAALLPEMTEYTANAYRAAGDYMKLGKWMMLTIDSAERLEDYKKMVALKLPPK